MYIRTLLLGFLAMLSDNLISDELRTISQKNTINALARPVTAVAQVSQQCEIKLSKQQKQKGSLYAILKKKSYKACVYGLFVFAS